jgi:predicted ATP-grasp superfamily ATP-dependent carboligase
MRIFVYEYTCAANLTEPFMTSLRAEGWAMLSAIVDDFIRIPGVEVTALLNCNVNFENRGPSFLRVETEEETAFRKYAERAEYTLVIAPEIENILAQRCEWVESAGGRLLGPSSDGVRLTGDKLALSLHWNNNKVPTPECWPWTNRELSKSPKANQPKRFPIVLKLRFGAGSLNTFLIRNPNEWAKAIQSTRNDENPGEWVVQSYVPGQAASLAFLIGPKQRVALPPTRQILSDDGRFHYLGGEAPLPEHLRDRACRLASRAIDCVPGLRGYVGVDLVLGSSPDGSQDWAIEINPRLTTSYIGLRGLAKSNLAEALLQISTGKQIQPLTWHSGPIRFRSDGHLAT